MIRRKSGIEINKVDIVKCPGFRFIIGFLVCFFLGPFILPNLLTALTYPFTKDEFDISNSPILIPPANRMLTFSLTPHKSIVFENGTEIFGKMYIKREISYDLAIYKHPRGIMMKIDDDSSWEPAKTCFASYPTSNRKHK